MPRASSRRRHRVSSATRARTRALKTKRATPLTRRPSRECPLAGPGFGATPSATVGVDAELEPTAPGSQQPWLHHLVQRGGLEGGISPFAAFAESLSPLQEKSTGGGSLLSRLGLSTCSLRVESGLHAAPSPMMKSPLVVGAIDTSSAPSVVGEAAGPGGAGPSSLGFSVSPAPENLGHNRQLESSRGSAPGSVGVRRASIGSETGATMDGACTTLVPTSSPGVPSSRKSVSPAASGKRPAGASSAPKSKGLSARQPQPGGSVARSAQPGEANNTPSLALRNMADYLDGGGTDSLIWDLMTERVNMIGGSDDAFGMPTPSAQPSSARDGEEGLFDTMTGMAQSEPGNLKKSKSRGGRPKRCNCRNSKCLKLYCECFSSGVMCDGCNCNGCQNTSEHAHEIETARQSVLKRNPKAFSAKFVDAPPEVRRHPASRLPHSAPPLSARAIVAAGARVRPPSKLGTLPVSHPTRPFARVPAGGG
jgi:hypothetical protein